MRIITSLLLGSCAFFAVPVFAADVAVDDAAAAEVDESDSEIVVLGCGETRQVQEIDNK